MKLPKVYEPAQYEADIYKLWETGNVFAPKGKGKPFSIVVPPPNANGNLHIGHALTLALEDIAIRYHRLKGDRALLVPGADHAGFETQVVYEKQLAKAGKSRFDFSREDLYAQIWEFVADNRENYQSQFRRLGASVNWTHYTFTLDNKILAQSYATFKKMWGEGLIYRGERLVNFCTFHGTAFADIEVEYKEEKGHLWYIRYPLSDGNYEVVVATTRPETMLGDTAVAVNPDDKRYQKFIGKTIRLPLTNREVPIISDDFVDPKFGTGAVKITPAHDPNDFDAGQRHKLPMLSVIDQEGKMSDEAPEQYRGLVVGEARKKVVADLAAQGFLVKTEPHVHSVGHCYKCGTVIQPLLRDQWFVDMQPLAQPAIKALKANEITFYPENKKQQLASYLENLHDWNISRQIAWGIPIPAFQNVNDPDDWIYDERVTEKTIERNGTTYRRDPDVFDTWFSSSSWPYATLDYPDSQDFKDFYPLSVMETGFDILMPWVSRMLMMGLYTTGAVPFKSVYLHGLVLDEHGQKMSKSKGNVVNPLEIVDAFGSDALRMGIISGQTAGGNQPFSSAKVVGARNFCNKLWNIARYVESTVGDAFDRHNPKPQTIADDWILTNLQRSTDEIGRFLDGYRFAEAYDTLYHFVWDDFADWYLEASKATPNRQVLAYCLESILKLAHPFAPFVTETIWQTLLWEPDSLLAAGQWPEHKSTPTTKSQAFDEIQQLVTEIRTIVAATGARDLHLYHTGDSFLAEHAALITQLAPITSVVVTKSADGVRLVQTKYDCWLDIDNATTDKYLEELADKRYSAENTLVQLRTRLGNKAYVKNAPTTVVDQTKQQLADTEALLTNIEHEERRFRDAATETTR